MNELTAACEKWLGKNWRVSVKPNGYYCVSFLYQPNNYKTHIQLSFEARNEKALIKIIKENAHDLIEKGKCL